MYHFVCHVCEEEATFCDLEPAQAAFNEHARREHGVVLQRVDPGPTESAPGPGNGTTVDGDRVD
ncbi:hypothetical protein [Halomicrobium salinisoli]|uniref:hypothetical protein n=1 Tax=Halomicrobium salinisoli TaxID=2878391 RepID=UPI001CEFCCCF|nr:hypothetical protein [Halomicrobium salinisoli]